MPVFAAPDEATLLSEAATEDADEAALPSEDATDAAEEAALLRLEGKADERGAVRLGLMPEDGIEVMLPGEDTALVMDREREGSGGVAEPMLVDRLLDDPLTLLAPKVNHSSVDSNQGIVVEILIEISEDVAKRTRRVKSSANIRNACGHA